MIYTLRIYTHYMGLVEPYQFIELTTTHKILELFGLIEQNLQANSSPIIKLTYTLAIGQLSHEALDITKQYRHFVLNRAGIPQTFPCYECDSCGMSVPAKPVCITTQNFDWRITNPINFGCSKFENPLEPSTPVEQEPLEPKLLNLCLYIETEIEKLKDCSQYLFSAGDEARLDTLKEISDKLKEIIE